MYINHKARKMDITKLKTAIPEELYKIAPGQVILFVPKGGLTGKSIDYLWEYGLMTDACNIPDARISVVETDNEDLIDTFVGRKPQDDGNPYNIIVCENLCNVLAILSECYGVTTETLKETFPSSYGKVEPQFITVDLKDCPIKTACDSCPLLNGGTGGFVDEVLIAKPESGSKAEKDLIRKEEEKIYSVLRECYVLDLELDIDKVKKKLEKAINDTTDYNLIIKVERAQAHHGQGAFSVFDIYVADGEKYKLDFTAAEKAIYLTFLLYGKKGIRVAETFWEFRKTSQYIYSKMPFDERCDTTAGGMVEGSTPADYEVYLKTLRGYLSTIRTKVAKKVLNPKTAIEFAIEGYKDEPFSIKRSTSEIRKQLKEYL